MRVLHDLDMLHSFIREGGHRTKARTHTRTVVPTPRTTLWPRGERIQNDTMIKEISASVAYDCEDQEPKEPQKIQPRIEHLESAHINNGRERPFPSIHEIANRQRSKTQCRKRGAETEASGARESIWQIMWDLSRWSRSS